MPGARPDSAQLSDGSFGTIGTTVKLAMHLDSGLQGDNIRHGPCWLMSSGIVLPDTLALYESNQEIPF